MWAAAALAVAVLAALALLLASRPSGGGSATGKGLLVVITMHGFEDDVKAVLCGDDSVAVLVPAGADPHSYNLRPSDLELLRKASIIVSTSHTFFEKRIEELVSAGELKAVLIRVPSVVQLVLRNPVTGQPNYHAVVYDPRNLYSLLSAVASAASKLRPSCSKVYAERLARISEKVNELLKYAGRFNASAVAEVPALQYAVEWLGVKVVALAQPEHGVQPSPALIEKIEKMAASGRVSLAVIVEGSTSPAASFLRELAARYGLRVVEVPSPLKPGSMLDKLEVVVERVSNAMGVAG